MSAEKTEAIVLRLVDFSESSVIVTLMTEKFGKISALAKGAKRKKSPFEAALDLLSVCRVVFIRRRHSSLDLLTEAKLEKRFRNASRSLESLYSAYYVAELLRLLTQDGDPHPAAYQYAKSTLELLDRAGDSQEVSDAIVHFELNLLRCLGQQPLFTQCVGCGKEREGEGRVAFGLDEGGVLCPECKTGKRHLVSLSPEAWAFLNERTKTLAAQDGCSAENEVPSTGEVRKLLNSYISHLLGFPPRLHSFIN